MLKTNHTVFKKTHRYPNIQQYLSLWKKHKSQKRNQVNLTTK